MMDQQITSCLFKDIDIQSPEAKKIGDYIIYFNERLGKGQYGNVYKANNSKTNQIVAAKISDNVQQYSEETLNKTTIGKEVQVMKQINHQNIIRMYDCKLTANHIYLFIEYCNGGNLRTYMEANNNQFSDIQVLKILKQICQGFQHLYQLKIIHRDIKPENILIHNDIIKIADFGFARFIDDPNQAQDMTKICTPTYAAPQIFHQQGKYSSKIDIWSIGMILYELLFEGKKMVENVQSLIQLFYKLETLKFQDISKNFPPSNRNPKLISILTQMLQYDENCRISWDEIFQSQWFKMSAEQFLNSPEEKIINKNFHQRLKINRLFNQIYLILDMPEIFQQKGRFKYLRAKCLIINYQLCFIRKIITECNIQSSEFKEKDAQKYILGLEIQIQKYLSFHLLLFKQQVKLVENMIQTPKIKCVAGKEMQMNQKILEKIEKNESLQNLCYQIALIQKNTEGSVKEQELSNRLYYLMILMTFIDQKENLLYDLVENLADFKLIKNKYDQLTNNKFS